MRKTDVLICGGGIAGISAALAAARNGAQVMLIEKQCLLGGLAVNGLITIYLPLDDGMGTQLSYGIAEELLHLSMKHGYQDKYPRPWLEGGTKEEKSRIRYRVQYNPFYFALECEHLLKQNNVEILYDTRVISVERSGNRILSVTCVNDAGMETIESADFIDASGNASLYRLAGLPTFPYKKGNIIAGWYYSLEDEKQKLHMLGVAEEPGKDDVLLADRRFNGITDKSDFLTLSHEVILDDLNKKSADPSSISTMADLRMIRRIHADACMHEADTGKDIASSIGMVGDWRKHGPRFEVPYESLYDSSIENMYACGRITGTDDDMWDVMRVIPCCAVTGEAAGTAAALGHGHRTDIDSLQQLLKKQGQKLFFHEIYEERK